MDYSNVVIITEPNITTLYVGQLVKKESLPALLEENFVTIDDIEFVPYNKEVHKDYIKESKRIYGKELQHAIRYSQVF